MRARLFSGGFAPQRHVWRYGKRPPPPPPPPSPPSPPPCDKEELEIHPQRRYGTRAHTQKWLNSACYVNGWRGRPGDAAVAAKRQRWRRRRPREVFTVRSVALRTTCGTTVVELPDVHEFQLDLRGSCTATPKKWHKTQIICLKSSASDHILGVHLGIRHGHFCDV